MVCLCLFELCMAGTTPILNCVWLGQLRFWIVYGWDNSNFELCMTGTTPILNCVWLGQLRFKEEKTILIFSISFFMVLFSCIAAQPMSTTELTTKISKPVHPPSLSHTSAFTLDQSANPISSTISSTSTMECDSPRTKTGASSTDSGRASPASMSRVKPSTSQSQTAIGQFDTTSYSPAQGRASYEPAKSSSERTSRGVGDEPTMVVVQHPTSALTSHWQRFSLVGLCLSIYIYI